MNSKLKSEFDEFMNNSENAGAESAATSTQDQAFFDLVSRDLNPAPSRVFAKLLSIHAVTTLFTLSVCPQFGFRLLGEGMGLMHFFSVFGEYGCLFACGSFFMGTSLLVASLLLSRDEIRQVRKHRVLELGSLALLSLGFFFMLDQSILIPLAVAWVMGGFLSSQAFLELAWVFQKAPAEVTPSR